MLLPLAVSLPRRDARSHSSFFLFLLLHIFMKLTKPVWHFSDFSMIFWWILQDLCFYRKRKKRKKRKKACMALVRPTAKPAQLQRFNPGWKKKPTFFWFFYEFLMNFARSLKTKEKEKVLHGLGPAYNEAGPIARFSPGWKRSPPREAHSDLDILHQKPWYISKTIKTLSPFLSLYYLYI